MNKEYYDSTKQSGFIAKYSKFEKIADKVIKRYIGSTLCYPAYYDSLRSIMKTAVIIMFAEIQDSVVEGTYESQYEETLEKVLDILPFVGDKNEVLLALTNISKDIIKW